MQLTNSVNEGSDTKSDQIIDWAAPVIPQGLFKESIFSNVVE